MQLVKTCETEEERFQVLRDAFGLVLSEDERERIARSSVALQREINGVE